ncbi:MAG: TolC family protein [Acidobacteria bacterium]|nr:TolC family protein [Acidobacteriota bacterium]
MTRHRWPLAIVVATAFSLPLRAQSSAPLTLRQAIGEALAGSPALRNPTDARSLADIRVAQAQTRFSTRFTPTLQSNSDPGGLETQLLGLTISRRLPTGTLTQVTINDARSGSGAAGLRDSSYSIGFSQPLTRGWTRVAARARRLVDASKRAVDRATLLRASSAARAEVGRATELDVLRADVLAAQADASLLAQQEAYETALDDLKMLIGRSPDDAVELTDVDAQSLDLADPPPVDDLIRAALERRLDLSEARARVEDARFAQTLARWNLLPSVSLDVQYTQHRLGNAASIADASFMNGWRVGLSSSFGLDRGDGTAAVASSTVAVAAAGGAAADLERRATDEVRRAYRAWTRTQAAIDLQTKAVDVATRQVQMAQLRYERGIGGTLDIVDAEGSLLQAESLLIAAQAERALATLALKRSSGTLDPDAFVR